jgi:predicted nucleic acid-binding protein
LLVDTSVWLLAFRRDAPPDVPEVPALRRALESGEIVVTTALVLQELLQGFGGPSAAAPARIAPAAGIH